MSLHVTLIFLPFSAWFCFLMKWELWKCEGQNENQKRFSYSQNHFLGVSQSNFVFQKLFLMTKTKKRNVKLNWQPLIGTGPSPSPTLVQVHPLNWETRIT